MSSAIERYVIRHLSGSKSSQVEEFDFNKPELVIGRAANCDIQFDPEQDVVVSREHGKIIKVSSTPPAFTVADNNSRNGIFVNKNRVKGSVTITPGDEIQVGTNGPVFIFDIYPRPQDMMMATKVMDIPASIKATTVSAVQEAEEIAAEPVKTGLGKQTVERMLTAERKKSYGTMALVIGGLVVLLGVLGYSFRNRIFPRPQAPTVIVKGDTTQSKKKSPDQIAKENEDRVVQIEFGWQLYEVGSSDELWHEYTVVKDENGVERFVALYIENNQGGIEPFLAKKGNVPVGVPIGLAGGSGSGFVVSNDGFILTNRHIGAGWYTSYQFPEYAFPGLLVRYEDGERVIVPDMQITPQHVASWVPGNAGIINGNNVPAGYVKGRNTYMNVIFAGTSLRRPVQSSTPSDNHDVALIKVEMPESLSKVTMKDNYGEIRSGQTVTVMGYPGISPQQFVVRRSNDPSNPYNQLNSIPTPTVTMGNIGRIIPASSEKDHTYSTMGDSYQLTINATGQGNSGGPLFDDEGNVIGIFYYGMWGMDGTRITFAVPIKYGLEIMGRKKLTGN